MRAAVLRGPRKMDVETRPVPEARAGEVVVEVDHCGICGTDLHLVVDGWGTPGVVPGHEFSGVIRTVGADVDRWVAGDRVVGIPQAACGRCPPCRAGRTSLCRGRVAPGLVDRDGAFAERVVVPEVQLAAVPGGLDLRVAALAEPLAVARHALTRGDVQPDDRVLVTGVGPIGAMALALLAADGVPDIHAVEPNGDRAALARSLGAVSVRDPGDLDVPSIAEPFRVVDGAFDVVLECSGRADATVAGLAQLAPAGRMVLVGTGITPPAYDNNRIILNELTVTGAYNYDADGISCALDELHANRLPLEYLVEPRDVSLDGLMEAMNRQSDGQVPRKILMDPRA